MRFTLCRVETAAFDIRKSRFIVRAGPLDSAESFDDFHRTHADPEARHNCWAFRYGDVYRFHDADEPSGTAGRPILAAIDGQELDRIAVIVIRWFGGIKLGAGGLVRAYGGSAAECLRVAERRPLIRYATFVFHAPFALSGAIHRLLSQSDGIKLDESFDATGSRWQVQLPSDRLAGFERALSDLARGQITIER